MTKESIYQLQLIDCNCNDCIFMQRDLIKFRSFDWLYIGREKSSGRINYGHCKKLNKSVTFIPGVCQPDTQECFTHRSKDNLNT